MVDRDNGIEIDKQKGVGEMGMMEFTVVSLRKLRHAVKEKKTAEGEGKYLFVFPSSIDGMLMSAEWSSLLQFVCVRVCMR